MDQENNRFRAWFDNLERQLEKEAELAGLFQHPTLTGSAREFLVKRVLKSVLPPIIHIGSGRIIDRPGGISKQIDIILYDSRFPTLQIEDGIGMYLIEGVIDALELKSLLTKKELYQSLSNISSILSLSPDVPINQGITFQENIYAYAWKEKIDTPEAERRTYFKLIPSTYVFAFNSDMSPRSLGNHVSD